MFGTAARTETDGSDLVIKGKGEAEAILLLNSASKARMELTVMVSYKEALAGSIKTGKGLVVLVGLDRPDLIKVGCGKTCFICRNDNLPDVKSPAIVVSKNGYWIATLPADATVSEIHLAIAGANVPEAKTPGK